MGQIYKSIFNFYYYFPENLHKYAEEHKERNICHHPYSTHNILTIWLLFNSEN